jgi:hypothetical protein
MKSVGVEQDFGFPSLAIQSSSPSGKPRWGRCQRSISKRLLTGGNHSHSAAFSRNAASMAPRSDKRGYDSIYFKNP